MSKNYEFFVTKQNTPHLQLYTKLICLFAGFTGLNFFLIFLYSKFCINKEHSILFLVLSIIMLSSISDHIKDPRKGNRDLKAVIAGGIVHGVCTIACAICIQSYWVLVVYVVQLLFLLLLSVKCFKVK